MLSTTFPRKCCQTLAKRQEQSHMRAEKFCFRARALNMRSARSHVVHARIDGDRHINVQVLSLLAKQMTSDDMYKADADCFITREALRYRADAWLRWCLMHVRQDGARSDDRLRICTAIVNRAQSKACKKRLKTSVFGNREASPSRVIRSSHRRNAAPVAACVVRD
jgi:hypothetical protein